MPGGRTTRFPAAEEPGVEALSPASSGVAPGIDVARSARAAFRRHVDPSFRGGDLGFRCAEFRSRS